MSSPKPKRPPSAHKRAQTLAQQFEKVQARIDAINAKGGDATAADFETLGKLMNETTRLHREMQNPPFAKLFNAAGDGQLARVRKYIERDGMHVDTRNYGGATPLCYAASDGNLKLVQYLIDQGADINARDNFGLSPLASAAAKNHADVFRLLMENGANVRTRIKNGLSVRKLAEYNQSHAVLAIMDDKTFMAKCAAQARNNAPKRGR